MALKQQASRALTWDRITELLDTGTVNGHIDFLLSHVFLPPLCEHTLQDAQEVALQALKCYNIYVRFSIRNLLQL